MNKFLKISMFALMAVVSTNVWAETSDPADGSATVKVRKALSVEETQGMDFATVTLGTGASTVSVDANGVVSAADASYTVSGTGKGGAFEVVAPANTSLTVAYTTGSLKSSPSGATSIPLTVDGPVSITSGDDGTAELKVGGELSFVGNEPNADYSTDNGTPYTVTVSYE